MPTFLDFQTRQGVLQHGFDFAQQQVRALIAKYPADYYPMYTVNGKFGQDTKRWTHWCDGFYPGQMFIFAEATSDSFWLDNAVVRSRPLADRQYDRAVHDLGFLFFSTYLRWKGLDGPAAEIDPLLIQAGRTMAMRFMPNGQYLRSFVEPASLFIDIMMNIDTVFYAADQTKDARLLAIAHRHCETSRRVLVRGDGSTAHEALFDLQTGECLRQSTHQGYRGDSCWSRGLAWSLYGFTRSYKQTARPEYLQAALANAAYYVQNTPPSGVAPWDYDAPKSGPLAKTQVDTSASAIAASGLLDLAAVCPDPVLGQTLRDFALQSLVSLTNEYLGDKTPGFEGVLNGAVYHIHKKLGVHEACLFGEYFFVEALHKALQYLKTPPFSPVFIDAPYPEVTLPISYRTWSDGPTEEEMPAPADVAEAR